MGHTLMIDILIILLAISAMPFILFSMIWLLVKGAEHDTRRLNASLERRYKRAMRESKC